MDNLITTAQAAELVGRSVRTFERWAKASGLTPAFRAPGTTGVKLYNRADVEGLAQHVDDIAEATA